MIRGISKRIIEVNDTGSDIFERAVFFVKSDCNFDDNRLKNEAKEIIDTYLSSEVSRNTKREGFLRYTERKKKNIKRVILGFFVALSCILIFAFIKHF